MRSTPQALVLKVGIIALAFAVCVAATTINGWQARPKAESWPAGGGGMSSVVPVSTHALW